LAAAEEVIAIFNDLMRPADQVDIILLEERLDNGFTKSVAHTSVVLAPAGLAFLGVRPKQVA
jgi:hypothetical protein